jgi:hypothetical protein
VVTLDGACVRRDGHLRGVGAEVGLAGHGEELEALLLAPVLGREGGGGDLAGGRVGLDCEGRHACGAVTLIYNYSLRPLSLLLTRGF